MNHRFAFLIASTFLAAACGGQISALPSDTKVPVKAFEATVAVSPARPIAGQRVNFNIEVVSDSNTQLLTDVELRVLNDQQKVMYQQLWADVVFEPADTWNLTEGYLPDTTVRTAHRVEISVREKSSGELLYRNDKLATLDYSRTTSK